MNLIGWELVKIKQLGCLTMVRRCPLCNRQMRSDSFKDSIYCGRVCFSQKTNLSPDFDSKKPYIYLWYAPDAPTTPIYVGKGEHYMAWERANRFGGLRERTKLFSHNIIVTVPAYNLTDKHAYAIKRAVVRRFGLSQDIVTQNKDKWFLGEQPEYPILVASVISSIERYHREVQVSQLQGTNEGGREVAGKECIVS